MDPITTTAPIQSPIAAVPSAPLQPELQQPVPPPLNAKANKKSLFLIIGIIILVFIMVGLSLLLLLRNNITPSAQKQITDIQAQQGSPTPDKSGATPTPASAIEEASLVDTGDATIDITKLQNDASTL